MYVFIILLTSGFFAFRSPRYIPVSGCAKPSLKLTVHTLSVFGLQRSTDARRVIGLCRQRKQCIRRIKVPRAFSSNQADLTRQSFFIILTKRRAPLTGRRAPRGGGKSRATTRRDECCFRIFVSSRAGCARRRVKDG